MPQGVEHKKLWRDRISSASLPKPKNSARRWAHYKNTKKIIRAAKISKSIIYHSYLIEFIKNQEVAQVYIEAGRKEGNPNLLRKLIADVIKAIGDNHDFNILQKAKQVLNASSIYERSRIVTEAT